MLVGAVGAAGLGAVAAVVGWPVSPAASRSTPPGIRSAAATRVEWSEDSRERAFARAAVWRPDATDHKPVTQLDRVVECRFKPDTLNGTTPKFECVTSSGDTIKVKYANAEPHGEVAATTFLSALGFPADDVRFVKRVRCYGCPRFPFLTMKLLSLVDAAERYGRGVDYGTYRDVEWPSVERKYPGVEITTPAGRGWAFHELRKVTGAPRAHVDALRLAAVFLAHWDNKSENQRLLCIGSDQASLGREECGQPLAMLQDLGATFGPRKVNLREWRRAPLWSDRGSCEVSMADMPHGGATFEPVRISERGRRFFAERLATLERRAIRGVFEAARFPDHDGNPVDEWTDAFEARVRQIIEGPACPES